MMRQQLGTYMAHWLKSVKSYYLHPTILAIYYFMFEAKSINQVCFSWNMFHMKSKVTINVSFMVENFNVLANFLHFLKPFKK
jgi:hypothetical protein